MPLGQRFLWAKDFGEGGSRRPPWGEGRRTYLYAVGVDPPDESPRQRSQGERNPPDLLHCHEQRSLPKAAEDPSAAAPAFLGARLPCLVLAGKLDPPHGGRAAEGAALDSSPEQGRSLARCCSGPEAGPEEAEAARLPGARLLWRSRRSGTSSSFAGKHTHSPFSRSLALSLAHTHTHIHTHSRAHTPHSHTGRRGPGVRVRRQGSGARLAGRPLPARPAQAAEPAPPRLSQRFRPEPGASRPARAEGWSFSAPRTAQRQRRGKGAFGR